MASRIYLFMCTVLLFQYSYGQSGLDGYHIINSVSYIYKIQTSPKSWTDAKATCAWEDAIIFYPKDEDEARDVLAYAKERKGIDHIWIGVYFSDSRDLYAVDGSSEAYISWVHNEPNNAHGNENCLELHRGGANDLTCEFEKPYICKKPLSVLAGPEGMHGLPGQKGVKGTQGPQGFPGLKGDSGPIGPQGFPGLKGDSGPIGPQGFPGLKGDSGPIGPQGFPGLKGDSGPIGPQGFPGLKGDSGPIGPQGFPGLKGDSGPIGPQGFPGLKGDSGPIGPQGFPGLKGDSGPIGPQGFPGLKGDSGPIGPPGPATRGAPGTPGLPGVCPTTCPVIYLPEKMNYPEDIPPVLGSQERPSTVICKFKPASDEEVATPDPYWVMEEDMFPLKCDKTTNRTCLMLKHNDTERINENKILIRNAQKGMWLSKSGLSLSRFNTIKHNQMSWLKEQALSASQMIRVYFTNTTFESLNLRLLNSYDVPIGESPSALTPMFYTVEKHDGNQMAMNGEIWKYVDLVIIEEAKRLPVVDFYVEYVPDNMDDAYISVQLRELCFG